jgi:hypothetical protein
MTLPFRCCVSLTIRVQHMIVLKPNQPEAKTIPTRCIVRFIRWVYETSHHRITSLCCCAVTMCECSSLFGSSHPIAQFRSNPQLHLKRRLGLCSPFCFSSSCRYALHERVLSMCSMQQNPDRIPHMDRVYHHCEYAHASCDYLMLKSPSRSRSREKGGIRCGLERERSTGSM